MTDVTGQGSNLKLFDTILRVAFLLAIVVVVLGAWTRLVDAGLGCPDWPGCYGFIGVPQSEAAIETANARFPDTPVEVEKAWPEMIHRYAAGTLGLLVLALTIIAIRNPAAPRKLVFPLAALVILQAAFGAWTVTLKLWPQVVTAHLMGGFATLSLLWLLLLIRRAPLIPPIPQFTAHARLALAVVIVQIVLGGWTSSNYAALACPDFPLCQAAVIPEADFGQGFNVMQAVGPNYLGGLMDSDARVAIHFTHRLGALVVLFVVGALAWRLRTVSVTAAGAVGGVLAVQLALGIGNVVLSLPLTIAVLHNAVGAALLLAMVAINYAASSGRPAPSS